MSRSSVTGLMTPLQIVAINGGTYTLASPTNNTIATGDSWILPISSTQAAVPLNFSSLSIDTNGNVSAVDAADIPSGEHPAGTAAIAAAIASSSIAQAAANGGNLTPAGTAQTGSSNAQLAAIAASGALSTAQANQLAALAARFCGTQGKVVLDLARGTLTVFAAGNSTVLFQQAFTVTPTSQTFGPNTV